MVTVFIILAQTSYLCCTVSIKIMVTIFKLRAVYAVLYNNENSHNLRSKLLCIKKIKIIVTLLTLLVFSSKDSIMEDGPSFRHQKSNQKSYATISLHLQHVVPEWNGAACQSLHLLPDAVGQGPPPQQHHQQHHLHHQLRHRHPASSAGHPFTRGPPMTAAKQSCCSWPSINRHFFLTHYELLLK